ncbi:unnamed protein product [Rhizophagus irregularis]|nr:unnamed protein product [Rhizophagus irregularis]
MINRFWCQAVIPILWRNPWCYDINHNKDYLFTIITSYLSDDTREFLTILGIQLPLVSHKSLTFDYLSFSKHQLLLREFYGVFMKKCPELKYLDMKLLEHQTFHFPEANIRFEAIVQYLQPIYNITTAKDYNSIYNDRYLRQPTLVEDDLKNF